MLLPIILDGVIQHVSTYESTNIRRFWAGAVGGIGAIMLKLSFLEFTIKKGACRYEDRRSS